jgi:transposase InsO family protein
LLSINAVAESYFSTLKREMEKMDHLESWEAANNSIADYINGFYNLHRRHSALNYNSPIELELIYSMNKKAA